MYYSASHSQTPVYSKDRPIFTCKYEPHESSILRTIKNAKFQSTQGNSLGQGVGQQA